MQRETLLTLNAQIAVQRHEIAIRFPASRLPGKLSCKGPPGGGAVMATGAWTII
jgi:hypothetical protein